MSGGHYNYKFRAVEEMAEAVEDRAHNVYADGPDFEHELVQLSADETRDRLAIADTLRRVAAAMRALEWYDSHDTSDWIAVVAAFNLVRMTPSSGASTEAAYTNLEAAEVVARETWDAVLATSAASDAAKVAHNAARVSRDAAAELVKATTKEGET